MTTTISLFHCHWYSNAKWTSNMQCPRTIWPALRSIRPAGGLRRSGAAVEIDAAARSGARLDLVCAALQDAFGLPLFVDDNPDTWRYAWAEGGACG